MSFLPEELDPGYGDKYETPFLLCHRFGISLSALSLLIKRGKPRSIETAFLTAYRVQDIADLNAGRPLYRPGSAG